MLTRKPHWLTKKIRSGETGRNVKSLIKGLNLNTVCSEARCPNSGECFSNGTATFLILGNRCTRNCGFCAIGSGIPQPPENSEPLRIAEAVSIFGLDHIVITSVTRDDLPDGGAGHFAAVIKEIRGRVPRTSIEILIPDFHGNPVSLETVVSACPDVINHNIETVPRLYEYARPESDYRRSLELLGMIRSIDNEIETKSGMMLGLGEKPDEIRTVLRDLLDAGCSMITIGQYLQPSPEHLPVSRFVTPDEFDMWRDEAHVMGFRGVASGPFVRSSYNAGAMLKAVSCKTSTTG